MAPQHDAFEEGPAEVVEIKEEQDLGDEEYYQKHGVAKPPPPPGGFPPSHVAVAGGAQNAVASVVNRLSKPAEKKILSVETAPMKALVALVTQMTFGSAEKAEALVNELLVLT